MELERSIAENATVLIRTSGEQTRDYYFCGLGFYFFVSFNYLATCLFAAKTQKSTNELFLNKKGILSLICGVEYS